MLDGRWKMLYSSCQPCDVEKISSTPQNWRSTESPVSSEGQQVDWEWKWWGWNREPIMATPPIHQIGSASATLSNITSQEPMAAAESGTGPRVQAHIQHMTSTNRHTEAQWNESMKSKETAPSPGKEMRHMKSCLSYSCWDLFPPQNKSLLFKHKQICTLTMRWILYWSYLCLSNCR